MSYTWWDVFEYASNLRTRLRKADKLRYPEDKREAIAQIKRETFDLLQLVEMPSPLRLLVAELWGGHTKPKDLLKDFVKLEAGTRVLTAADGGIRTANIYVVAEEIVAAEPDISMRALSRRINERLGTSTDYARSLGRWQKKRGAAVTGG